MVLPNNISTTKLLILAILGFCALILGSAVLTLQLQVISIKQQLSIDQLQQYHHNQQQNSHSKRRKKSTSYDNKDNNEDDDNNNNNEDLLSNDDENTISNNKRTIQSSDHSIINLHKKYPPPDPTSPKLIGEIYWNQVVDAIQDWDVMSTTSRSNNNMNKATTTTSTSSSFINNNSGFIAFVNTE